MRIGYLGPPGTFTQQAAVQMAELVPAEHIIDYPAIEDALCAVMDQEIGLAVAPLENSTEGVVNATIDTLLFDCHLYIQYELVLPIAQCLMRNEYYAAEPKIDRIYSHSQSLAQCRKYLREKYPEAELHPMTSNAEAARFISQSQDNCAAIGPALAAGLYHLKIVSENIQDQKNNATTFIALSESAEGLLAGKTTIAFSTLNQPGSLYKILDIFSLWDINMTKILSRPMKNKPGEYVFYVDLEDYEIKDLEDALIMVRRKTDFFKYLGSYRKSLIP